MNLLKVGCNINDKCFNKFGYEIEDNYISTNYSKTKNDVINYYLEIISTEDFEEDVTLCIFDKNIMLELFKKMDILWLLLQNH